MYPEKREETFLSRAYKKYKYSLLPRVKHVRGTTRLKETLKALAATGINKPGESEPIGEKEWDNLIILDAARHDTYRETLNNKSNHRITQESHSRGFIRENFSDGDWRDTAVITANPFYNSESFEELTDRSLEDTFETIFHVWETDWNSEEGTVMPDKMVEKAFTAEKLFPDKRKIIHMMQPHHPFIDSDIQDPGFGDTRSEETEYEKVWERTAKGEIPHQKVVEGYLQNHRLLKPHLEKLKELSGKTVVTADHGNLLGENGLYGHPPGNLEPLRKVPWDVISQD